MSRWEDLLDEPPPEPNSEPLVRSLEEIKEASTARLAGSLGVPVELLGPVPTWQLGKEEPPDHVVRLAPIMPPSGFEPPDHASMNLARMSRSSTGEPRGWWWIPMQMPAPDAVGWSWRTSPNPLRKYHFRQVLPVLNSLTSEFTRSLIKALPYDEEWYRIGTFCNGTPVWAWISDHSDFDTIVLDHDPGQDE